MNNWKAILAALVIFAAGTVTGALILKMSQISPARKSGKAENTLAAPGLKQRLEFLRRLEKPLKLTDQQRQRIERIVAESQEHTKAIWQDVAPQIKEELDKARALIRTELDAEQRLKFDENFRLPSQRKPEGILHRDTKRDRLRGKETNNMSPTKPESLREETKPVNAAER